MSNRAVMRIRVERLRVVVLLGVIAGAGIVARAAIGPSGGPATPASAVQAGSAGNSAVVPFTIHVPDDVLADLKQRLARARFPDEVEGAGWDYGTNLAYLKELVAYWRDKFDWRAQERKLNQFEQFKTNIDGLNVHSSIANRKSETRSHC